jgi:hypothetical protein
MSTKLACSAVPTVEICPNCESEMTIREVTPILLADGFEDVTYRCKSCRFVASMREPSFDRRELSASPTCLPNGPASTRCSDFRRARLSIRTESPSATVSVAGKRDFQGGEKSANTSPEPQISGLRDEAVVQKPRRFGAFRTPAGNLRECGTAWWSREDSNLQPDRYERSALTIELRARSVRAQAAPRAIHAGVAAKIDGVPYRSVDGALIRKLVLLCRLTGVAQKDLQ